MKSIFFTTMLLFLMFLQSANAQSENAIERKGFVFGTSYGAGYSVLKFPDKNQNELGFALDLKLGYMINPNLALMLSTNVSIYDYSGFGRDRKRDFGILAPTAQYWLNDKFWVLGGIGLGGDNPVFWDIDFDNVDDDPLETKYYNGLGLVAATGYEIYQRKNMAVDIKAKLSYRNVEMQEGKTNGVSFAFLVGINLY